MHKKTKLKVQTFIKRRIQFKASQRSMSFDFMASRRDSYSLWASKFVSSRKIKDLFSFSEISSSARVRISGILCSGKKIKINLV